MKKLDLSGIGDFPRIEYQHIAASFLAKTYGISRATVYNLVNSFEIPKLDIERFEEDKGKSVIPHFFCKLWEEQRKGVRALSFIF